jgi:tripartite-type tricarboxylate transporter receptor subunit TctC
MKRFFVILLMLCIVAAAFSNGAQSSGADGSVNKTSSGFPNRPIEIYVPGDPGTGTDVTLRAITPTLEKYLGVPITVLNESASQGEVAFMRVVRARPDGYTWCFWNITGVAITCTIGNLAGQVDVLNDLVYAGGTYIDQNVFVTKKDGPFKTVADLINAARGKPGDVRWGRYGPQGTDAMCIGYIEKTAGVKFNPIDGLRGSIGMAAIMGGHVDVMVDNISSSLSLQKDGAIEIIAVGGDERVPELPNVQTYHEAGFDIPMQVSERHFFGPAKMDKEIVDFFAEAVRKAVNDPEYKERCKQLDLRWWYADAETSLRNMRRYVDAFNTQDQWF